jgi:uroporphyrinogen decarboxylase
MQYALGKVVMNGKERFLNACQGEMVDRPPVWLMRQAGRTLPEYLKIRETHSFWDICRSPELAATVTMQPVDRFGLDGAVIFSDILVIPQAMGLQVDFSPSLSIAPAIRRPADVEQLLAPKASESLAYVGRVVAEVKRRCQDSYAVIGFSGAPFTLACYMIEGRSSHYFNEVRQFFYRYPAEFQQLLEKISGVVIDYCQMQINCGATVIQLFDTWAGQLSAEQYQTQVLPWLQKIISAFKETAVPIIYYINGIGSLLESAAVCGAQVLGIDWRISLSEVRQRIGSAAVLQGNLDPAVLFADRAEIHHHVTRMIQHTHGLGHIVNLGHGLLPYTPLSGIEHFVNAVKNWLPHAAE